MRRRRTFYENWSLYLSPSLALQNNNYQFIQLSLIYYIIECKEVEISVLGQGLPCTQLENVCMSLMSVTRSTAYTTDPILTKFTSIAYCGSKYGLKKLFRNISLFNSYFYFVKKSDDVIFKSCQTYPLWSSTIRCTAPLQINVPFTCLYIKYRVFANSQSQRPNYFPYSD